MEIHTMHTKTNAHRLQTLREGTCDVVKDDTTTT